MDKIICQLCKKEFSDNRSFSNHLRYKHKDYTKQKYYDDFLKKDENDGICKVCGSPTKFISNRGLGYYNTYCSFKCQNSDKDKKNKTKETVIKKYGVDNISKLDSIKEKIIKSQTEKYGGVGYLSNILKEKAESTNLKRYGSKNPLQSKRIQDKLKNINLEKLKNKCNQYNVVPLFDLNEWSDSYVYRNYKCVNCGSIISSNWNGTYPKCKKCNPIHVSSYEKELYDYITDELNISKEEIMQSDRSGIAGRSEHNNSPKELNLYLPKYKFAIEYDGLYWHSEKYLDKNYHLNKTTSCESNGIQLLHIFENEWLNPIKQDIWKSIISTKLNMNNRVYARKCSITEINSKQSMEFLNNNHLQGGAGAKYHIGLFYNNELISVATFGKPRFNKNYEFELVRFANKKFISVIGGFSKLLKYFERIYNPSSIITYADRRISSGNLYEKTGFKFLRDTNPNYFYINEMELESRIKFQKHKLKNLLEDFNPDLSEHENMLNHGIFRIYDVGNKVYEKRMD
jgi:hypothetical protein